MKWGYGKILDSLVSPEGRLMTGGFFEDLMYGVVGVHSYQFRQTAFDTIVLYLVPSVNYGEWTERFVSDVQSKIRSEFSTKVSVRVERVDAIPPTPSGKHQFVVSEVRGRTLHGVAASGAPAS